MKIHAIETGKVWVKETQRIGKGTGLLRQAHVLFDSTWTEALPIYCWAIETDEGVIVVDTGETSKTSESGYFPAWHPYFRLAVRVEVQPHEEVGPRLEAIGINIEDVSKVILTHLHTDHAGGVHHFPKSQILVSSAEYGLAKGFMGRLRGYLPNRWPIWLQLKPISFEANPIGPFLQSCRVTRDGSVVIVPTPGHTDGHVSVIVIDTDMSYFLAGDLTYTEQALINRCIDGVSPNLSDARQSLNNVHAYIKNRQTVYLPAHDPESAFRLEKKQVTLSGD